MIMQSRLFLMSEIVTKLQAKYPKISFTPSDNFFWSPETNEVFYKDDASGKVSRWSLLHEVGHAPAGHRSYDSDFMLLRLELEAWQQAKTIGSAFGIAIDDEHIQNCLDTYRDWLHKRSVCPRCSTKSLQTDPTHYTCHNCHMRWRVTASRFCRT